MTSRRGFPVGLTAVTAIALLILLALGTWQVQRLQWKRDLVARIQALQDAPARPLGPVLAARAAGQDIDFTRVAVSCPGLSRAPYLELYGLRDGKAGSRLISACAVDAPPYRSVLVDRGFVEDIVSSRPPVDAADRTPVQVTGVLRSPDPATRFSPPNRPERWFTRDVQAMARELGAERPAPVVLMAETSTNPEWKAPVPAPLPRQIANRHLEDALTW